MPRCAKWRGNVPRKAPVRNADGEKQCLRCKEFWPPDPEFFYRDKDSYDGWQSWCKACSAEFNKQYRKRRLHQ